MAPRGRSIRTAMSLANASRPSGRLGDDPAQNVTRVWNEWLAADRRQHASIYHRYISALAEEERAAAVVERVVNPTAAGREMVDRMAGAPSTGHASGCR